MSPETQSSAIVRFGNFEVDLRSGELRKQFFLAAAAQNIKRLVRYLSQSTTPLPLTT